MHSERTSVIARREKEDHELQNTRRQEDDEWNKRMEARDSEEDVSNILIIRVYLSN